MFSAFRMGPAASGLGLCDIDSLYSRKSQKNIKKMGRFFYICLTFSELITVQVHWRPDLYEILKTWNLSYVWYKCEFNLCFKFTYGR